MSKKINKTNAVLITGAAKRVGREMSLYLASQGFDVAISYNKSAAEAKKLQSEISKKFSVKCEIFCSDLSKRDAAKNLAKDVIKNFPNWNLLINNASIFNKSKLLTESESEMLNNFNIHLFSPLILTQEFAKNIAKKNLQNAQVINMIDKNITRSDTSYFHYLLSKKSLAEMTKMLALELAPQIRVNGIAPGLVLPNIDEERSPSEMKNMIKRIPLETKGETENILQTLGFLLGNHFVNGEIIFVDGGASLNHA